MKKFIGASLAFFFASFLFISCQKTEMETDELKETSMKANPFSSPEIRALLTKAIEEKYGKDKVSLRGSANSNGVTFLPPINMAEFWGFPFIDGKTGNMGLIFIDAYLDNNDFYRKKPDGTISVSINTKDANLIYILGEDFMWGKCTNFNFKYTGVIEKWVFENPFTGEVVVIEQLVPDFNSSLNMQAGASIGPNGMAPWSRLGLTLVYSESGQINGNYHIN